MPTIVKYDKDKFDDIPEGGEGGPSLGANPGISDTPGSQSNSRNPTIADYKSGSMDFANHHNLQDLLRGRMSLGEIVSPKGQQLQNEASSGAVRSMASSFMPEGTASPLGWLAEKTGVSSVGDRLMQKAVGLKKYIPGVGDSLVEQGVGGTKGMMQGQIASGLEEQGGRLQDAVSSIPGKIDNSEVAQQVSDVANKYRTSLGRVPEAVQGEMGLVNKTAQDIGNRGMTSPQEALDFKRIAQQVGYKQGEPLSKLASQLAQKESSGYGSALENAYQQSAGEGAPNVVADANEKLSALLRGKKGLNAPESLSSSGLAGVLGKDAVAGGIGALVGGPVGATAGVVARHALSSPAALSAGAHVYNRAVVPAAQGATRLGSMGAADIAGLVGESKQAPKIVPYDKDKFDDIP